MNRGGLRPGSGRLAIEGKEVKLKLPEELYEQLELNFTGKSTQDRIRECLTYGINQKINSQSELKKTHSHTVVDLFSGAGGLSRGFMDAGFKVLLGVDFDDAALKTFSENQER